MLIKSNQRSGGFGWGLFLVAFALVSLSACSLRYDFTECETRADCARIENPAAGELYQCVNNECVRAQPVTPDAQGPDTFDTQDTSDARDSADSRETSDSENTNCETTRACITQFGESYYCAPSGECVDTASELCDPVYYPGDDRGKVILLGSIIPTQGAAYASLGKTIKNAVRMAVIEYTSNALTLLGGQTVAHLHCEGGSKAIARQSAEHMHAIGVPVVVGPLTSASFIEVMRQVGAANPDAHGEVENPMGAIAMSATATAMMSLDSMGKYAFQIIANDEMQSWAMADRTRALRFKSCAGDGDPECTDNTTCRDKFGPGFSFDATNPGAPCKKDVWKIAVFYKSDQYGDGFHNLLIDRYYGRDIEVKYYEYPDPADLNFDPSRIQLEYTEVVLSALDGEQAQPDSDLVVFVGTGEATSLARLYIGALVQAQGEMAPFSRRYIFSHGAAADAPDMFSGDQPLPTALIPFTEAIAPNIFNEPHYGRWQQRYSLAFGAPATTSVGAIAYDAANMGLFAMASIPADQPVDGAHVTAAIAQGRLQDAEGTEIILKSGTASSEARRAFRDGHSIDMVGVSGDLNFVFDEEGKNLGTVRSNYLGFDIAQTPGSSTYEVVPTRLYLLNEGEDRGVWMPLPTP